MEISKATDFVAFITLSTDSNILCITNYGLLLMKIFCIRKYFNYMDIIINIFIFI